MSHSRKQPLAPGHRLASRYVLRARLGAGSMAEVWLAHDERQGNAVALKVLAELLAPSERAQQRFSREVAAIGRIAHHNVVRLLDHGALPDGRPFLVMEYHHGETLAQFLEHQGRLGGKAIRSLGNQILAGLGAAHAQGIIHRDLKPANLQLVDAGEEKLSVKILDFGVARIRDIAALEGGNERLTNTGTMLGSPRYVPLEVARGAPDVNERSDLFEVGAVLYHCATGIPPFSGNTIGEVMRQIVAHQIVAIVDLRPKLNPQLRSLIEKALAHDPKNRFSSADEMRAALLALPL